MQKSSTMQKLLGFQTFPYAASSTGPYRGLLVRKYPCWDARGAARDLFTSEIAGKIKACLEQCLPESNSFVGFSLFMVGKVPEKTKPTIMIVSDHKARRKEAFQVVKTRNLLAPYPGFELGHCSVAAEFEDLRRLGLDAASPSKAGKSSAKDLIDHPNSSDPDFPGDEIMNMLSAEVCAFETLYPAHPTRVYFHTKSNYHSHALAFATCGDVFEHDDEFYTLTMAHAIHPVVTQKQNDSSPNDSSSESDDFEMTGFDDREEDDEGDTTTLTAITSPGSQTPSEISDSEENGLKQYDSFHSSEMSLRPRIDSIPPVIHEDEDDEEDDEYMPDVCERIGSVVSVDEVLDIAVIKLSRTRGETYSALEALSLVSNLDNDLNKPFITVKTIHHPDIRGRLSATPYYTRLPGASNFLELHSVQLSIPLRPGDSGSCAFDENGSLVGFVVAGSPKSGSCLLLPAATVLQALISLLLDRTVPRRADYTSWADDLASQQFFNDLPDQYAATVASSLPPPSIFSSSQRMDRSATPSVRAYSAITAPYEYMRTQQGSGSMRGEAAESIRELASSSNSSRTGDFWKDQSARLRRELERAWEIIQEKDQVMQTLLVGDLIDRAHPYAPVSDTQFSASLDSRIKLLNAQLTLKRTLFDDVKTMYRNQAEDNEILVFKNRALHQENMGLKNGIREAITRLRTGHGQQADLVNIALDLERALQDNDIKPTTEPEPESEPESESESDPEPKSSATQQSHRRIVRKAPLFKWTKHKDRRTIPQRSWVPSPLSLPRGQSSLINTVVEEEGEDNDEDDNAQNDVAS